MTNRERILEFLRNHPDQSFDDDELSQLLEIYPRQRVNQICRTLAEQGLIFRQREQGKIRNSFRADAKPALFEFLVDSNIRDIVKRDYFEIQKCLEAECWKAVIILCGGCLEAILYDALKQREAEALRSMKRGKGSIEYWTLVEYIEVAAELGLITKGVESFSHSVRDFRNLVHPVKEVQGGYKVRPEEAKAAFEVLKMAISDLKEKGGDNLKP